jgi:1-phosphofructokinase family hexose kinase
LILTVTANPAIDRNVGADRLVFDDRAYILDRTESAGGRGINASTVIHSFGGKTFAVSTQGGEAGEHLREYLQGAGYGFDLVPIASEIRTNLTITDKSGLTVKLNEAGPPLSAEEVQRLEASVRKRLPKAKWVMLCGSLPPGVPSDFYARLIDAARAAGVSALVDADGDELLTAIEARPTVVTPNQQEAERLLNRALLARSHFIDAVDRIQAMGAEQVLLSLGSRGALGRIEDRVFEAVPPRIEAVCPIGAGDAMAAAFVWARAKQKEFWDALRWSVAAGTASTQLPGMAFATLEQTKAVYKKVEVRPIR